jgi:hypothetical protein
MRVTDVSRPNEIDEKNKPTSRNNSRDFSLIY